MYTWIPENLILKGRTVSLLALQPHHIPELAIIARDPMIWQHYAVYGGNPNTITSSLHMALNEQKRGLQYAFVLYHEKEKQLIGSTRYLDLQPLHRKLEIGWTWLLPAYWGKSINTACKFLLFQYAFEVLKVTRVQLRTDVKNERSRKAIMKVGATEEGIIRNDMIREDGSLRDSVYYSVIASEWERVSTNLKNQLHDNC